MKRLLLCLVSFSIIPMYAKLSVKDIENMVQKIHLKREGIRLETLEQTKEPFVRLKKEDNVTIVEVPRTLQDDVKLSLHAIMGDKAYINNEWKKVGDNILGYTVKYIGKKGVVLRNGNTIKKLFLAKRKNDFIMLLEKRD